MALKLFDMKLSADPTATGVFFISLIDDPAIDEKYITLSKQLQLSSMKEDQRIITGLALIPDTPIYRKDNKTGEEYYIQFSSDTIKGVNERFMERSDMFSVKLGHKDFTDAISIVESWIVEDEKNDKLCALGLSAKKGGWAVSMKVNSDELWEQIKNTDMYSGFSIEGLFTRELANNQIYLVKQVEMEVNERIEKLTGAVEKLSTTVETMQKAEEVRLEAQLEAEKEKEAAAADEKAKTDEEAAQLAETEATTAALKEKLDAAKAKLEAGETLSEEERELLTENGIEVPEMETEEEQTALSLVRNRRNADNTYEKWKSELDSRK